MLGNVPLLVELRPAEAAAAAAARKKYHITIFIIITKYVYLGIRVLHENISILCLRITI